jgi:hypothetical protein
MKFLTAFLSALGAVAALIRSLLPAFFRRARRKLLRDALDASAKGDDKNLNRILDDVRRDGRLR